MMKVTSTKQGVAAEKDSPFDDDSTEFTAT